MHVIYAIIGLLFLSPVYRKAEAEVTGESQRREQQSREDGGTFKTGPSVVHLFLGKKETTDQRS